MAFFKKSVQRRKTEKYVNCGILFLKQNETDQKSLRNTCTKAQKAVINYFSNKSEAVSPLRYICRANRRSKDKKSSWNTRPPQRSASREVIKEN